MTRSKEQVKPLTYHFAYEGELQSPLTYIPQERLKISIIYIQLYPPVSYIEKAIFNFLSVWVGDGDKLHPHGDFSHVARLPCLCSGELYHGPHASRDVTSSP